MALISFQEEIIMPWEAPDFEETSLCCEISSYANAEL
jgi:hypothetical protein